MTKVIYIFDVTYKFSIYTTNFKIHKIKNSWSNKTLKVKHDEAYYNEVHLILCKF